MLATAVSHRKRTAFKFTHNLQAYVRWRPGGLAVVWMLAILLRLVCDCRHTRW